MVNTGRVEPEGPSIVEAYKGASKGAAILHLGIGLLTTSVSQLALKQIEPVLDIAEIVALTAPLTAAVAIVTALILNGRFAAMSGMGRFFTIAAAVIVPYLLAEYFGVVPTSRGRQAGLDALEYLNPGRAMETVVALLEHYFSVYGAATAVQSIACGAYLGWAVTQKLLPAFSAIGSHPSAIGSSRKPNADR